eukprot:220659_1
MDEYYILKESLYKYIIKPNDNKANNRNLIELDFGNHIIDWKIKPKFYNMKQEWLQNDFAPIESDVYDSLYYKSSILANTKKNKSTYNLPINGILCIKMYTDTNDLQGNFRHAFR